METPQTAPGAQDGASPPPTTVESLLSSATPEQSREWQLTGKLPTPGDQDADSPSAPSGDQSASTDASVAASEPATPVEAKPKHKNAETRIQELLAERAAARERAEQAERRAADLEAKLAAGKDAKSSESSPETKPPADWQRYAHHPDIPKSDDFDNYEDFVTARGLFVADQRYQEREARANEDRASQQRLDTLSKQIADFNQRLEQYTTEHKGFQVHPELLKIAPDFAVGAGQEPGPLNLAMGETVRSEHSAPLLAHFSTEEGRKDWIAIVSQPTPAALLKAFAKVEARFDGQAAAPSAPAKTITDAPPPPMTLGKRGASAPVDSARSSLKAGDFSSYAAQMNARELAAKR